MTQYQVPQFVEVEDRIIGPLTLKQFLYLAFAGAILFVAWFLFQFYIWIIIAVPTGAIAAAFAFLKINERPFSYFFLSFLNYHIKPKLYLFSTRPGEARPLPQQPAQTETAQKQPEEKITRSKLKDLAASLDAGVKKE